MTSFSVLIHGVQQTQNLAASCFLFFCCSCLLFLFLVVFSRRLHGIHVSMQLCASVKESTEYPLRPGLSLNQSSLTGLNRLMSTLSKSPSPCPAMPGHRNIRPWLVFYVGTWDLNLGLYPLSISQAPESAFLIHYSIIFLKTLVNQGAHMQVPVVWRCPKNMYLDIHLAYLVRSLGLLYRMCVWLRTW